MIFGTAKIGDWVRPAHLDKSIHPYKIKAIYEDGFGRVLLRTKGGTGFGEHYCVKVRTPKHN